MKKFKMDFNTFDTLQRMSRMTSHGQDASVPTPFYLGTVVSTVWQYIFLNVGWFFHGLDQLICSVLWMAVKVICIFYACYIWISPHVVLAHESLGAK